VRTRTGHRRAACHEAHLDAINHISPGPTPSNPAEAATRKADFNRSLTLVGGTLRIVSQEPLCEECGHPIADTDIMCWYGWKRVKQEGHVARWMYFHFKCWERWQMKEGAHLKDIAPSGLRGRRGRISGFGT
jgi:hypothetical protein